MSRRKSDATDDSEPSGEEFDAHRSIHHEAQLAFIAEMQRVDVCRRVRAKLAPLLERIESGNIGSEETALIKLLGV